MVICVECGRDIKALYREFSRGNIWLSHCPHCGEIADKYVELEAHIVFIDLVLHRVQAYRHMLFNRHLVRIGKDSLKFLAVIFAFDSFDKWFKLQDRELERPWEEFTRWLRPHPDQWIIPACAIFETVVYLSIVCFLVNILVKAKNPKRSVDYRFLLSTVIFSCFSKLGVLLWMVWDAPALHRKVISWFTITSNIVAVQVFLRTKSYIEPTMVVMGGFLAKSLAGYWLVETKNRLIVQALSGQ